MDQTSVALIAIIAYLIGSLPFASLVTHTFAYITPRCGIRTMAFLRVVSDIFKGSAAVFFAGMLLGPEYLTLSAFCVFLGHTYPLARPLDGGYGMGVLLGAVIAVDPTIGLFALVAWTAAYYVFQFSSVAAFISALATPLVMAITDFQTDTNTNVLFAMAALVFWRQRDRLILLVRGEEEMVVWE